jgi:hypothetical protein
MAACAIRKGRVLLAISGEGDPKAVLPYPPQAWQRKARSEEQLAARKISVPADLPPLVSEPELRTRAPEDILRRMLALYVVAIRAESLNSKTPLTVAAAAKLPASLRRPDRRRARFPRAGSAVGAGNHQVPVAL